MSNGQIPAEAVEAAARNWVGTPDVRWEAMTPLARATALTKARRALEAAAPHILKNMRPIKEGPDSKCAG